ncbi:MAG: TolC family protein [Planctomycetes bacterium]|nr:TolC family protein [Planctomycetota bacterium]
MPASVVETQTHKPANVRTRTLWGWMPVVMMACGACCDSWAQETKPPTSPTPVPIREPVGAVPPSPDEKSEDDGLVGLKLAAPDAAEHVRMLRRVRVIPIDLATSLNLAGFQNPELLIAQTRVSEAVAERQLAAAQFLPTINLGTSLDSHTGVLQQSSGNILSVRRQALFFGAGANAIAAGTVNIPGIVWNFNASEAIYNALITKQVVTQHEFLSEAARNEVLRHVVHAYLDLLETNGDRSVRLQVRESSAEVARVTAAFAKTGQGRPADAERAATELYNRDAELLEVESRADRASAMLARLVGLDQSARYHPIDNFVVPHSIVPNEMSLPETLAIAVLQRPELKAQQAAIARSLLQLDNAKMLPFSPNLFIGFSVGGFGGGSNLVAQPTGSGPFARSEPQFGNFANRTDLDVMAYWSLQNMGVGNKSMIELARSHLRTANWEEIAIVEQVRKEVSVAKRRSAIRFAQLEIGEVAMAAAADAFKEDLTRIKANEGLPIEVLDSLKLLERAQLGYLRAVMEFNRAQFDLYVALGQPPADMLARPANGKISVAPAIVEGDDAETPQKP